MQTDKARTPFVTNHGRYAPEQTASETYDERFAVIGTNMNRERINLIETDIESAMTFLRIAMTELELANLDRASSLLSKAKDARSSVAKFLGDVVDPDEQQRLREKHRALDEAIGNVERRKRRFEEQD